ncbi:MAG: hypothetical protein JXA33_11215 [Anaerolineae bacterium]|nr:hypothetical protein [Anaerolineae bacterium]
MKITTVLKPGGEYIEGDCVTCTAMESQFLAEYRQQVADMLPVEDEYYHTDVPFSLDTQHSLLLGRGQDF